MQKIGSLRYLRHRKAPVWDVNRRGFWAMLQSLGFAGIRVYGFGLRGEKHDEGQERLSICLSEESWLGGILVW